MVPSIPPEMMLLAGLVPAESLRNVVVDARNRRSSRDRLRATSRNGRCPKDVTVNELFKVPGQRPASFAWDKSVISWRNAFLALERGLEALRALVLEAVSKVAPRSRAEMDAGTPGAQRRAGNDLPGDDEFDFCPARRKRAMRTIRCLHREIKFLERYEIEEKKARFAFSRAFRRSGTRRSRWFRSKKAGLDPAHPALVAAERWLLDNQILGPGDWQVKNQKAEPGGWAFEFQNDFYPDVDDTAFVLMALGRVADPDSAPLRSAIRRGLAWLVSMQNSDGGWGAFDHENNLQFLNHIPFADHNAMLDPSTADVTARVL